MEPRLNRFTFVCILAVKMSDKVLASISVWS